MSEEKTPNEKVPEQEQKPAKGDRSIKSLVGMLRASTKDGKAGDIEKTEEAKTPVRRKKRLQ